MHLRILYKQLAFSDFSVETNISSGEREMRYLSIILVTVLFISCSTQDENEQKATEKQSVVKRSSAVSFRNVDMEVKNGKVVLIGEAKVTDTRYVLQALSMKVSQ